MKRAVIIGGVVTAVTVAVTIGLISLMPNTEVMPSGSYEKVQGTAYEFEIPTDWQFQPSNTFLDTMINSMILEASNGRIYDSVSYEYSEPESLETNFFPTSIQLSMTKSDLTQNEYYSIIFEIGSMLALLGGMDFRIIDSRQDILGEMPAVTLEYVMVDMTDSGIPTFKMIETTTTTGSMMYSISYSAELDDYDAYLHHFQNAVKTFRFT